MSSTTRAAQIANSSRGATMSERNVRESRIDMLTSLEKAKRRSTLDVSLGGSPVADHLSNERNPLPSQ